MGMFGNGNDLMSDSRFRLMAFFFSIRDRIAPHDWKIDQFGLRKGDIVVDFGCGTGSCLNKAAEAVGERGTVFAVDIHDLAVDAAKRVSRKHRPGNIRPVKACGFSSQLPDSVADCVYALDMFHMVSDADRFLGELRRIIKSDGRLFLEDGHQPRSKAKEKVMSSRLWRIIDETRDWMVCVPSNGPGLNA